MPGRRHSIDPYYSVLSLAARINPTDIELQRLSAQATACDNWQELVEAAEINAVAPLLFSNLRLAGVVIPTTAKRQLHGLWQRHRWANELRAAVLGEIIDACNARDIPLLVLKGAYLAQALYPEPAMRSMSDIDLLTTADRAADLQQALRELGFSVPVMAASRYMLEHHHLPTASLMRDGLNVAVEIHHDALSGDAPSSITLNNLTGPTQRFSVAGRTAYALGHQDQLRHLYHHMAEPASRLKLIWVTDLVYYAARYHDELDWHALRNEYPAVYNALRLMTYVMPLPRELADRVEPPVAPAPSGVGQSILPLGTIMSKRFPERIRCLLYPSDWWLRLFYGVAPDRSLFSTRWFRHPRQIAAWLMRRMHSARHAGD